MENAYFLKKNYFKVFLENISWYSQIFFQFIVEILNIS